MTKEEFLEKCRNGEYELFNAWDNGDLGGGQCDIVVKDADGTPWMCEGVGFYGYMNRPLLGGFLQSDHVPVKAKPVIGIVEYVPVNEEEEG